MSSGTPKVCPSPADPWECVQGRWLPSARVRNPCLFAGGNSPGVAVGNDGQWKGTRAEGKRIRLKPAAAEGAEQRQPGQGRGWKY